MLSRFLNTIDQLKFHFGFSVLELFVILFNHSILIGDYYDLIDLAKDEKIKQLIEKINDKFREHYSAFKNYGSLDHSNVISSDELDRILEPINKRFNM